MTKRTKPKVTPIVAPTISSTAPVSPVESDKAETNTVATPKPKRASSKAKKAPSKPRARSKKAIEIVSPTKVVDAESRIITYVNPMTLAKPTEPKPSLYDRFVCWLFKVTYLFRGY